MPSTIPSYSIVADSATATGLKWAAPAGSSLIGVSVNRNSAQSLSNDAWNAISFNTEAFDEGGFWDSSPNPTRLTIPSGQGGKYMCTATGYFNNSNTSGTRLVKISKNGSDNEQAYGVWMNAATSRTHCSVSTVLVLVATDYLQFEMYQNTGGALNTDIGVHFSIYKIG